jgi:hypothetical protein
MLIIEEGVIQRRLLLVKPMIFYDVELLLKGDQEKLLLKMLLILTNYCNRLIQIFKFLILTKTLLVSFLYLLCISFKALNLDVSNSLSDSLIVSGPHFGRLVIFHWHFE